MEKENRLFSPKKKFIIFVGLFLLLFLFSIYCYSAGIKLNDIKDIPRSRIFPILFIFFYATISFLPLPLTPTSFLGGIFFTFQEALLYTLLGSLLFATLVFYMTRFLGRDYIRYLMNRHKKFKKLELKLEKGAFFEIFMLRMFFIIPSEFIGVVAGLSNMKYKDFILATFIANTITLIFSVGLVRSQIKHNTVLLIGSLLGLLICLIIPLIFFTKLKSFVNNRLNGKN